MSRSLVMIFPNCACHTQPISVQPAVYPGTGRPQVRSRYQKLIKNFCRIVGKIIEHCNEKVAVFNERLFLLIFGLPKTDRPVYGNAQTIFAISNKANPVFCIDGQMICFFLLSLQGIKPLFQGIKIHDL